MDFRFYEIVTFLSIISIQYTVSNAATDAIEPTKSSEIQVTLSNDLTESVTSPEGSISDMFEQTFSYSLNLNVPESILPSSTLSIFPETFSSEINNQTDFSTEMFPSDMNSTEIDSTGIHSTMQTEGSLSSIPTTKPSEHSSMFSNISSELLPSSIFESTFTTRTESEVTISTSFESNSISYISPTSTETITFSSDIQTSVTYSSVTPSSVTHSSVTTSSTTGVPGTSTKASPNQSGMSAGGKVAVGITVVVCCIVLAIIGIYCYRRRKKYGTFNIPYRRWTSYGTPEDEIHLSFNEERL